MTDTDAMNATKDVFARNVFEVLYSPVKAFAKIIEKPDIKGPLLIFAFTMIAALVGQYAILSRIFLESGTGGYVSLLSKGVFYFRGGLVDSLISTPISFFFKWILLFVALWVSNKMLGHQIGAWKRFLIVVGYLLIVGVIYSVAIVGVYSAFPELRLPKEAWNYWNPEVSLEDADQTFNEIIAPEIETVWNTTLAFQLLQIVSLLSYRFDIWTVGISAVAVRSLCEISWKRAAVAAVSAYIIYILLRILVSL